MADYGDDASKVSEQHKEIVLKHAAAEAAKFDEGKAGECDSCGETFMRVVFKRDGHYCGGCRDKLGIG